MIAVKNSEETKIEESHNLLVAFHTIKIRLKMFFFLSLLVDTKQRPILPNGVEIISLMIITGLFIGSNFP